MLFQYQEDLIEIVRERPYNNVLTIMATTQAALKDFITRTPARVQPLVHPLYRWMIHVAEKNLPLELHPDTLTGIEVVDRLTAEPINFYYQYTYVNPEGKLTAAGGYCWADESNHVTEVLQATEFELIGEVTFIPLFRVSRALITPRRGDSPDTEPTDSDN